MPRRPDRLRTRPPARQALVALFAAVLLAGCSWRSVQASAVATAAFPKPWNEPVRHARFAPPAQVPSAAAAPPAVSAVGAPAGETAWAGWNACILFEYGGATGAGDFVAAQVRSRSEALRAAHRARAEIDAGATFE